MKAERALLHGLARHGWDGQREVPKETVEKYGLTEDFAGIARLRWDYHLSEDNGDFSRDYPEAAIGRHNRAIRERAAKELAGLEARLFPEKGGKPGTEGCAPAGGQPGKPHGIAQTGTEGAARQAANRGDRQKEASGEKNQNVGQP